VLNAGYFDYKTNFGCKSGRSEGSIISPILANIYMNEFDKIIINLKNEFEKENPRSKKISNIKYPISKIKEANDINLNDEISEKRNKSISSCNNKVSNVNVVYVRYAEQFIIGIRGSKEEALKLKKIVLKILVDRLYFKLNKKKIIITNLNSNRVMFLDTYIFRSKGERKIVNVEGVEKKCLYKGDNFKLRFEAPVRNIIKVLTEAQFLSNGKSAPQKNWLHFGHNHILYLYNSLYIRYCHYYSFVDNYNKLISTLMFILKSSCAKLLATKFNIKSQTQVYKKYGIYLKSKNGIEFVKPKLGITLKYRSDIKYIIYTPHINKKYLNTFNRLNCLCCCTR
jgi:hypothetical protein